MQPTHVVSTRNDGFAIMWSSRCFHNGRPTCESVPRLAARRRERSPRALIDAKEGWRHQAEPRCLD
jgi:hypothetical protein